VNRKKTPANMKNSQPEKKQLAYLKNDRPNAIHWRKDTCFD
jgi:hypothetical protein